MRLLSSCFTLLAATALGTNALEASVFTFDSTNDGSISKTTVISDSTLRQLLELRTQSSTLSTLGQPDESTLKLLSNLGGASSPLFSVPLGDGLNNVLVMIEAITDEVESSIRREYQGEVTVASFPSLLTRDSFFDSLLQASPEGILGPDSKRCEFYLDIEVESAVSKDTKLCTPTDVELQTLPRLFGDELLSQISMGESQIDERTSTAVFRLAFKPEIRPSTSILLKSLFSDLSALSSDNRRVTAVVLSNSKQSKTGQPIMRRDSLNSANKAQLAAFDQRTKSSLALTPLCYASNSSCNEATNTCSGHGSCYRKSGSENDRGAGDCYACQCYETIVKGADGSERRVQWGGSACQKRDISSPFFLIAGVAVAVAVAVSTAIGMIYQVGNSELPGVISAGVGTVKAQK
ncbi:hypothetical protein ARAM_002261 [Aspergillus rambellii]|uniref:Vacuolar sorting protein Vps3844 C-terminal domain-containing protein n=2 Tax=Aspergillus subgen. Nidulantes TaxID=2720870 RepID=A0A0F8TZ77_9EURO|nr:hypothetical protein ARAM_002261 [Aspergillus rambellii]KKK23772.1 hypothetical protein AOCH_000280 [Aspergillus ochraceoroseus]